MNFENYVLGTLSQDAFVLVNKRLARKIGFTEAGLLAELIFTHKVAKESDSFFEEGAQGPWFYLTQAKVEENLGIKRREHENAIKNLVKCSIIKKERLGLPAKNYYQINWKKIVDILDENEENEPQTLDTDRLDETYNQGWTKRTIKDGRNVQTGLDETSIHTSNIKTNIKTKDKNLVNKENKNIPINNFSKGDLLDIANLFYNEFSIGRWSKKQWFTLINQFVDETLERNPEIQSPQAYIYSTIKTMAYDHDLKNGKIKTKVQENLEKAGLPFYNWLED